MNILALALELASMNCGFHQLSIFPLKKHLSSLSTVEDAPMSRGSYGHPELCASPCIRAFYSKCTKGFLCEFCHLGHSKPKCKLNKHERRFFDSLDESDVLSVLLSLLREKCAKLARPQQDVLRLVLAAVQHRIKSLAGPNPALQKPAAPLRRFSLGRFFEVIQQCKQVDPSFKAEMKRLVVSARTSMQNFE